MDHEGAGQGPGVAVTSREQDAVRLLLLIDGACAPLTEAEKAVPGLERAVGVMRTQVKLQKLDFWLRNPDYLANELLTAYEAEPEEALLELAGHILDSEEPEVRRYPMLRHHFGAYEWLDDALAVLCSAGLLVRKRRGTVNRVRQHDYFLLEHGRHVAREIIRQEPDFGYYVQRVEDVLRLAGEKSGSELKKQQYLTREYADTPRGSRIGSISGQARRRLTAFRQQLQVQGAGGA